MGKPLRALAKEIAAALMEDLDGRAGFSLAGIEPDDLCEWNEQWIDMVEGLLVADSERYDE